MRENALKRRLAAGETVLGSWLSIGDGLSAEAMASLGWDWLLVDMEHGPISLSDAPALLTAIRAHGVVPIVRVAWNESSQIQRALDLGTFGILVPVVNNAGDARRVVQDARFPPLGERSLGGVRPGLAFGTEQSTYGARANAEVLVLVQIETETAVSNADAIFATEGIDGAFVGPNDLAVSAGKRWPDVWERDADYMRSIEAVAQAARRAGKVPGILARDAAMATRMIELGYRFVGVGSDIGYLTGGARRELALARGNDAPR
jgi:4-hydroxy-2-oxoheptanedioate aldolase